MHPNFTYNFAYYDEANSTDLAVRKNVLTQEAVLLTEDTHHTHYISISPVTAVDLAKSILEASGIKNAVVELSDEAVTRTDYGNYTCGSGEGRAVIHKSTSLEEAKVFLSNVAAVVVRMEKDAAAAERKDAVAERLKKAEREEIAELVNISMPEPDDAEGLKALDELIKRRKGL